METKGWITVVCFVCIFIQKLFLCKIFWFRIFDIHLFYSTSNGNLADGSMSVCPLQLIMAKISTATFVVDEDLCYGCGACIALCPTNALDLVNRLAIVEQSDCTLCEHCIPSCPVFALSIKGVNWWFK